MVHSSTTSIDIDFLNYVFPERAGTDDGRESLVAALAKLHNEEIRSVADLLPIVEDDATWAEVVTIPKVMATRLRTTIRELAKLDAAAAAPAPAPASAPTKDEAAASPVGATPASSAAVGTGASPSAPVSQVDIVLVDVSRSMKSKSTLDVLKTREDWSKLVFHALIDGLVCLEESHTCSIVSFGERVNAVLLDSGDLLPLVGVGETPTLSDGVRAPYRRHAVTNDMESCHTFLGRLDANEGRTRLYDAIVCCARAGDDVAHNIAEQTNGKKPHVRVFALTDGDDNASVFTPVKMAEELRALGVTLDAFPMAARNPSLYAACELTGGICVSVTGEEQAMTLFQDEALLHVAARARRREPLPACTDEEFRAQQAACPAGVAVCTVKREAMQSAPVADAQATMTVATTAMGSGGAAAKRVGKELADAMANQSGAFAVRTVGDSLMEWACAIKGPSGTPFANLWFRISASFPDDYPFKPPRVRFLSTMFHPNINSNGSICLDILKDQWSPALTMSKVLLSLNAMLGDPNADDPLVPYVAQLYKSQRDEYNQRAAEMAAKHGSPTAEEALA